MLLPFDDATRCMVDMSPTLSGTSSGDDPLPLAVSEMTLLRRQRSAGRNDREWAGKYTRTWHTSWETRPAGKAGTSGSGCRAQA